MAVVPTTSIFTTSAMLARWRITLIDIYVALSPDKAVWAIADVACTGYLQYENTPKS